jgi:hypothetical protein
MTNVLKFKPKVSDMDAVEAQLTPIGQTYSGVTIFENNEGMLGTYLDFLNYERLG